MRIELTATELLKRRLVLAGLQPLNSGLDYRSTEGVDVDTIVTFRLRQWYLDLLDHGAPPMLAPENIAADVGSFAAAAPSGGVAIELPAACRRVFSLKMKGWQRSAPVGQETGLSDAIRRQLNPYSAATAARPLAILSGRTILAWPAGTGPQVQELTAVLDPGPGLYIMDESALSTLPVTDILQI
ncbi:MAG: hypothetical protein K2F79_04260 [Muribaculaceae bacterium]|nr:hypothetical protein [Muribaculaceae bacterium]